ncbi:nuclear transport factor 2 family protein [Nocardioides sp.]|uniref:nuclear transport factor 2 family protein n=1 Tax=Nocardioides sp. TaxID=35761 RepID=UPI002718A8BB|nr:nuclear transport factor 2 family protein [Nocardioides sp.]MDO9454803.1 nuclear transport factor 2 family protein [Nocardioides sp.]
MKVTQDNVLGAVQILVDKDEIAQVLYDYANFIDLNETDSLLELFTPDCFISYGGDHGADGIDAYRETLQSEKFGVGAFFAGTSHHVSNVVIDLVDPDTAHVRSALYAWHKYNRDRADGVLMGQYHDILVRTDAGWRIKRRELKGAGTQTYHAKFDALNPIPRTNTV